MTWLNPWAWLGLAALAVPVAIHFLTRAQPRPQPFPTLRFLAVATTSAMRRRLLRDRALLAVRLAILVAVVAALAQPYVRTAGRLSAGASAISRAVVIDTSASMNRQTADGRRAVDVARERAQALLPTATATTSIDAERLADGIAAATTWLGRRGGRGELVVLSDFQQGSLAAADLASVPTSIGVTLTKIDVPSPTVVTGPATRMGDRLWTPRISMASDRTSVTWTSAAAPRGTIPQLRIVGGPADAARIATALAAANDIGTPAATAIHPVVIELPDAPGQAAALASAHAIDAPWMFDVIDRVRRDASVAEAATLATVDATRPGATSATVVMRDAEGTPAILATSRGRDSGAELVLSARSNDPLVLAALVRAAAVATMDPAAIRELEPVSIPPDVLARWQRPMPSTGSPAPDDPNASDGRWFWIASLVLLGVETWMRRHPRPAAVTEVARARVA